MPQRGRVQVSITADSSGLQRDVKDAEGQLGKLDKAGSRSAHGLGTAFKTAGGLIAGAAVADQIKETITAAEQAQTVHKQLGAQLKAVGVSYRAHAKDIDGVIKKTSQLSGISEKDLSKAFTNIVRGSGSVSESLKGTAIAADLARARHMDVAKAGDLVAKAYEGNVGALKRMGIAIQPVTTAQDKLKESVKHATVEQQRAAKEQDRVATGHKAIAELQKRVGGQAEAYGKSAAGAQDRFRVAVEHLREAVGIKLLPVITTVATKAADFVNQMTDGTGAGGRFAAKLKDVANAVKPIVKFFTDHPEIVALAVAAWGAYKAAGVTAAAITHGKVIASFLGLAPKAAVGGAEAGASFGGAASAEANTKMRGFGWSGLGGKIGTALGVAAGAAAAVEVANALSKTQFVQGIADSIGSALGIIDPKSVRDARNRANQAQWHRNRTTTVGAGTTGPTISLPQVAAGHHSGIVHHHPQRAPHPGTTAHGAVAHASSVHPAVVARAARAATGRPAGRYTAPMLARLWVQAGGPASVADTAAAIALAESGGDPGIVNSIGATGLWQIHPGGQQYLDPMANARAAVAKYKAARGFTPWTTYTGADTPGHAQTYKAFLGQSGGAGARATAVPGGTSAPSPPTAADYARHAAHRVAPITSAFGHASGLEGHAANVAGSAVETYSHDIGETQRVFGRHPVDLNTVAGRMQHVFDLTSIRGLQARKLAAQRRQVAAKRREITLKRQEITRLMAALRRGSRHQRPAIRAKVKGLQADIRTLKADIRQLGFDIDDSVQDVADTDTEISTTEAGPQDPLTGTAAIPGADAYQSVLNRDAALAALTPDTADDLAVAKRQQAAAQAILTYEQAHPGQFTPDDIAQAATNLKSANDTVTQLTGGDSQAATDLTAALTSLRDELKRQNDFATSVTNVTSREAVRALADIISGQITGTGYDPRAMTAGVGALARY